MIEKNLPKLVIQYLKYITTIKNRSIKTANAYAIDLSGFFRFYKSRNNLEDKNVLIKDIDLEVIKKIKLVDIYEYLHFVMTKKNNSARARARKVSSIRGFFRYLTQNLKLLDENPVEHLESPHFKKTIPKYLSIDESRHLLQKKSTSCSSTRYRDYCILTVFLNCGMRVSELVAINFEDIKFEEKSLKLLGKGNKQRVIFLNQASIDSIKNYIVKERKCLKKISDKNALFLASKTGKRLGVRQVQKIVELALKEAGLFGMGYSPHKLRHTAATLLYQYGNVDILILKELLGHENVGTTQIYTHISNRMIKKAVEQNPLSSEKIKD